MIGRTATTSSGADADMLLRLLSGLVWLLFGVLEGLDDPYP